MTDKKVMYVVKSLEKGLYLNKDRNKKDVPKFTANINEAELFDYVPIGSEDYGQEDGLLWLASELYYYPVLVTIKQHVKVL